MKKYSSETAISILAMIQAGIYTIGEICAAHNINRRTFTRWRAKYPKFARAIEDLRIDAIDKMNIEARNGLMKRLKGCDIQIVAVKRDHKGNIIKQVVTTKHVEPDTGTIIFVLTNGDPKHWKKRGAFTITDDNGNPLFPPARILTKKEAREYLHIIYDNPDESDNK